jgi:hypothetical protein
VYVIHPRCVCGIVGVVDPRGGFWVVRPDLIGVTGPRRCDQNNFCGVYPMDLVPLHIMLSVEAFGKVWCWSEEVDRSCRTYPWHVSCHNLPWGIISASRLRIGWTKTPFRSSLQELRNGAIKRSIWRCLSRCFICAMMSHYDLHLNHILLYNWYPLTISPASQRATS